MLKEIFLFLGPQGSGKGTQANMLSEHLNLPNLSTGDYFRKQINANTKIGEEVGQLISEGNLVPDETVNILVSELLQDNKYVQGVIFDGYPRNATQAEFFLNNFVSENDRVFLMKINIPDKDALKRISGRLSCVCGETYQVQYKPPAKKNICNKCGRKLFVRKDDKEETIRKRLKIFHNATNDMLEVLKKDKRVNIIDINGARPIKDVFQDIIDTYKKIKGK